MKKLRKVLALVLAMVMVLGMSTITAFAAKPATVTPNGKGTITIKNAVKGETYTVYRLFNAQANATTHAVVYGKLSADQDLGDFFKLDDEGYVVAKSTTDDTAVGTDDFKQWAISAGAEVTSSTAEANGILTFSNLDYGYYYVTSSQGAAISVDSLNPDAEITDKNFSNPNVPTDAKRIVTTDSQGNKTLVGSTSAAIGDTVDFQILFDARNYDNNTLIESYTITDTPSDLSINTDTVKVYVIQNPGTVNETSTEITGLNGIAATGLNITIPWVTTTTAGKQSLYANKSQIKITYTATVTSAAEDGMASNTATITWTGKENPDVPTPPTVKTYSFTVQKVDGKDTSVQLEGAEFNLYTSDGTAVPVVAVYAEDGTTVDHYRVATSDESGVNIVAGLVTIKGLKEGNYQLEEVVAPKGYNKLTEKTTAFTVDATSSSDGVDVSVLNNQGSELPSTGGMGTTLFYVFGAVLVIGAGIVLVTRRRMAK